MGIIVFWCGADPVIIAGFNGVISESYHGSERCVLTR